MEITNDIDYTNNIDKLINDINEINNKLHRAPNKGSYFYLIKKKKELENQLVELFSTDIKSVIKNNLYTILTPLLREAYSNDNRKIRTVI